jgi:MFS family permease
MRSPSEALSDVPRETSLVVGLVSGSQFVNHMYLVILPPILGILAEEYQVTLAALGIALGVQGATNTASQLPFGHLADNYDRTVALAASSVLGAVGVGIVALAPTFEWLVLGQAVVGVGVAGHHPTHYPLLSDATPESLRGRAFSVYGFGGSLGFATPPVFITAVIALSGYTWRHAIGALAAVGLVYAVVVVAVVARRVDDDVTRPNTTGTSDEPIVARIQSEARALAAAPGILLLALLALLTSTAGWGFTSYAVVMLTDGYGVGRGLANLALTGAFVAGAVAILLGGDLSDRVGPGPVMLASYGLLAAFVGVLAVGALGVVPGAAAVGVVLLIGAVRSLAGPARSKLTDDLSSRGSIGRNFAVTTVGIMLGGAVAPPVFGFLIERNGLPVTFLAVAVVAVAGVAVTFVLVSSFAEGGSAGAAAAE